VLRECTSDEFKRPEETMAQGLRRHAVNLVVDFWIIGQPLYNGHSI